MSVFCFVNNALVTIALRMIRKVKITQIAVVHGTKIISFVRRVNKTLKAVSDKVSVDIKYNTL